MFNATLNVYRLPYTEGQDTRSLDIGPRARGSPPLRRFQAHRARRPPLRPGAAGSDGNPGQNNDTCTNPDIISNGHWTDCLKALPNHWNVGTGSTVVSCEAHYIWPHHYIGAYLSADAYTGIDTNPRVRADRNRAASD